ncbi:hypothetical protein KY330_05600 [Candidatus Woesearchaeota archaeon]|nr:hypothetical protein [Candidatus Woesearchaeota archaeon]
MHYKTKSTIVITSLLVIMFAIAFTINGVRDAGQLTGAAVSECNIICRDHSDCFDDNECTKDLCINPFECNSYCEHNNIC